MIRTHYDTLQVARTAPPEVIRAAYKALAQSVHPDRNGGDPEAVRKMRIINDAYDVLSDPERRRAHDRWIREQEGTPASLPPITGREPGLCAELEPSTAHMLGRIAGRLAKYLARTIWAHIRLNRLVYIALAFVMGLLFLMDLGAK